MVLIKIAIVAAACALTATVTVCFLQWHGAQEQADRDAAFRQAIYKAMKPPPASSMPKTFFM